MAQNLAPKKLNYVRRLAVATSALLQASDNLSALVNEWNGNAFATGATPTGNNITDADLSGNALIQDVSYITASELNTSEGAVVSVISAVASNRGFLESLRP